MVTSAIKNQKTTIFEKIFSMDKSALIVKETITKMLGSWQAEFEEPNGRHKMSIHISQDNCRFIHELDAKQIENIKFNCDPQPSGEWIYFSHEKRKFYVQRVTDYTLVFGEAYGETIGNAKWQRIFRKVGVML